MAQTETDPSYPRDLPSTSGEQQGDRDPSKLPDFVDKSEALFSMYLDRSDEDDRKTTERWKGESDAILIFTGLFSAALATLLSSSVQGLQPSPQNTSAFYLGNIYHVLVNTTRSQPVVYPTPSDPPPFSPPKSAVVVNALWFLSLSMSLTGALLAVFIQQWALSYLQATQERHSPRHRARIRAYHAVGLQKLNLHRVTRAVPILIHLSLFLFFSGLPVFLFNVNYTVFNVVVTWLAICVAGYACITLMPIFCHDSPYYSPLSSSIWWFVTNTLFIVHRLLTNFLRRDSLILQWYHTHYAGSPPRWPSLGAMQKASARFALQLPNIDYDALLWVFRTLNNDDEFEKFFDALPSLYSSEALEDPQKAFIKPNQIMLSRALIGMMDRTLLSDLVREEVKQRRIIICTKAIDATSLLEPSWILRRVLFGDWHGISRSIHFGLFVQGWKRISDPVITFYAEYVVAVTLASAQVRDDNWYELASTQLKQSKSLLRGYYAHYGDSILLANAIFIIRRTIQILSRSEGDNRKDITKASEKTLELICRFDIQNTLPEHQHQFCNLWNQVVHAAQNDTQSTSLCKMMLKSIRRLYLTLHEDTPSSFPKEFSHSTDDGDPVLDDAKSFPKCEINEHKPSLPVPELEFGELPRDTRPDPASSVALIPVMSPGRALIPAPRPAFTPHPSDSRRRRPAAISGSLDADIPTPYNVPLNPSPLGPPNFFDWDPYNSEPYNSPRPVPDFPPTSGPHYPVTQRPQYPVTERSQYPVIQPPYYPVNPGSYSYSVPPPPGVSGPTTTNRLEHPSPPIRRSLPVRPLPTPASAAASRTAAPVPPVILSSRQERMSTPPSPPSVPQEPTLSYRGTMPVNASWDTGPTRHGVRFDIPSPSTRRGAPAPLSSHGIPAATSLSASSSRALPIPTHMTGGGIRSSTVGRGGHAWSTPLATPRVIKFNEHGEFSWLMHCSPHSVVYDDELYPTALHLFEARKFLPHRPDLANLIREHEGLQEVALISAESTKFIRRDWVSVELITMDEGLYLKFRQHSRLRKLLFNTYPSELVYVGPRDPFWGDDGARAGQNELGKSLMRVRERLRIEGGM